MSLKDKHEKIVTGLVRSLENEGFKIEIQKSIGKERLDIVGITSEGIVLIEVKPSGVDVTDLMSMESSASLIKSEPEFKSKEINKFIITQELESTSTKEISKNLRIKIIKSDKPEEITRKILSSMY